MLLEQSLLSLHKDEFRPAQRPVVPPPQPPDVEAFIRVRREQAMESVPLLAWSRRREAKRLAEQAGRSDADAALQQAMNQRDQLQHELDREWTQLLGHDQRAVHEALEEAFEDNQSPAACIDVDTENGVRFATVLILFGPLELVPERQPSLTPTGRPTLRKRTKTERNDFYVRALASSVLATVKEGFAVAPSVAEFRVVVIRKDPHAADPQSYLECIYSARFPRDWIAGPVWAHVDLTEVLLRAPDAQMQRRGTAGNVVVLPVADQPGLGQIIDAIRSAGELG